MKSKPNVTEIRWGFKKNGLFWKGVFKLNQFKQYPNQPVLKRCVCLRLYFVILYTRHYSFHVFTCPHEAFKNNKK